MPEFGVRRLGYALGAEVCGLDLRIPLSLDGVEAVRSTIREHQVLVFRDQRIDEAGLLGVAERFGAIEHASRENVDAKVPQVSRVSNKAADGKSFSGFQAGKNWHSDHSYTTQPTLYSFLAAQILPPAGGDTMFANMYMAYESLSPAFARMIEGLQGIHPRGYAASFKVAGNEEKLRITSQRDAAVTAARRPAVHPVVRVHPETGRKLIYLGVRVTRFVGLSEEESKPIADFLNARSVAYEHVYRHRWSLGDVVMWDNRCTMHIALSDYDYVESTRSMFRCSVKGEFSGYEYSGDEAAPEAAALKTASS
jgi:taurine dioxygenase